MIKKLTLLLCATLALAACKKEKETPNGMKYTVLKSGDGVNPKPGDMIVFDFQMVDSKDSTWASSFSEGIPAATRIQDSVRLPQEDGMTQMFRMLSVGDSVTTTFPIKELYAKMVKAPMPPRLDSTMTVKYTIAIKDITSLDSFRVKRPLQVFERDKKMIEDYLKKNNLTAQKDSAGFLYYILHNQAGGAKPTPVSCVEVKYTGTFLKDGKPFDKAERVAFPLTGVIEGWRQGIPLLGVGDSATLFIVSELGYGPRGYPGAIPPDAVLMFNVTLLGVNNAYDRENRVCVDVAPEESTAPKATQRRKK